MRVACPADCEPVTPEVTDYSANVRRKLDLNLRLRCFHDPLFALFTQMLRHFSVQSVKHKFLISIHFLILFAEFLKMEFVEVLVLSMGGFPYDRVVLKLFYNKSSLL